MTDRVFWLKVRICIACVQVKYMLRNPLVELRTGTYLMFFFIWVGRKDSPLEH